jgi:hypothetical protein
LTQEQPRPDDAISRAAAHLAHALSELQEGAASRAGAARAELAAARTALEDLARDLRQALEAEREQRILLGEQLTSLAGSLDRLVTHLEGLSQLIADLLERLATPAAETAAPEPVEPAFTPGGEGISVTLTAVPGFQALMDIQKALMAMEQVVSASVERFQEGDSRLLLHLRLPISASEIAAGLRAATGHAVAVEEARPELLRLRLKIVPSG